MTVALTAMNLIPFTVKYKHNNLLQAAPTNSNKTQ